MASFADPGQELLRIETANGGDVGSVTLRGEADMATLRYLDTVLERFALDGAKVVRIDVSELDFSDVCTVRRLALFAKQAKQAGRHITTRGASPTLRMLAAMLGVDEDLGFT